MRQPSPTSPYVAGAIPGELLPGGWTAFVRRHLGKMLLCFTVVMTAVTLWTIYCPRSYRAEAKLLLRLGRENVTLDPTVMSGSEPVVAIPQSRENELNSAAEVLRSRVLWDKVIDAVGAEAIVGGTSGAQAAVPSAVSAWIERLQAFVVGPLSLHDRAVLQLEHNLAVEPIHKTDMISVAYQARTRELAQQVTAKLVELYLEEHIRVNTSQGAHRFLSDEAQRLRDELSKAEQQLRDAKNAMGLASGESAQQMLSTRIARLEDDRLKAEADLAATQARTRKLQDTLAALPPTEVVEQVSGFTNEGTDNMRGQYYTLQVRVQELASKYHEGHPLLVEAQRQLADAQRTLKQEQPAREHVSTGRSKAYQESQLAMLAEQPLLAAGQAQAETLRGQLAEAHRELQKVNEYRRQLSAMEREDQLLEGNYRRWATNLEQARIDQALERQRISNISVAQPAMIDPKPSYPRPTQNLLLGLALAAFTSLGLALLADRREDGSREVVEPAAAATLITIPRMQEALPRAQTEPAVMAGGSNGH